ncbi:MAG: DUF4012 domain-containing protein [Chloroflexi bacterium]|nr:MAG: DUF4012 domain-containing protein [Chloroflexota bacterium]
MRVPEDLQLDPGLEDEAPMPPLSERRKPSRRRRQRRPWRIALGLVVLLLLGIAGATILDRVGTQHAAQVQVVLTADLKQGGDELLAGKQSVSDANTKSDPAQLVVADQHFKKSRRLFQDALDRTRFDPWLVAASITPGISSFAGPRIRSVGAIARMGLDLVDAGSGAAAIDAALLGPSSGDLHGGQRLVQILKEAQPKLDQVVVDLQQAKQEAGQVDLSVIPATQQATVANAKAEIQKGLDGLGEFQALAPVLLDVLGETSPKTYLIEQVDPAELRGGGGFIGSYALLSMNKGEIKLELGANVANIDIPYPLPGGKNYLPQPSPLDEFTGGGRGWVFGDANFFPDFATGAQAGEDLFFRETGKKVDGVISIDPWAVAALLTITGPVAVPGWNTTVRADTFPQDVFVREEQTANGNAQQQNRKDFFPDVANLMLAKLSTLPADQWTKLIGALNTTVTQRHLQVYFNPAKSETEMDRMGWSGRILKPAGLESMLEVESNFGGDKANHFLDRVGTQHAAQVHTPAGFLGGRAYRCYLRFYYPAGATNASIQVQKADARPTDEKPPEGLKLLDGWFQVNVDPRLGYGTYAVVISWDTALSSGATGHSIYWQKQPGTLSDAVKVSYSVNGMTYHASSDLSQDRVLVLTGGGLQVNPGAAGNAHLPTLG